MSDRSRSRSSKWDLKEGLPLSPENICARGRELHKLGACDGDGGCSARMSPGLNDWRRQNHGHSPRGKWDRSVRNITRSRSRSRSPVCGFRQKSGNYDRKRSRSAPPCRDFAAGRCRRGSDCPFIHQGNGNYDDSWEDRHRKGGILKYSTARNASEYSSRSRSERECERNRSTNTLCKSFADGNCHRGNYCRFVHVKTSESPQRKMEEANKYWDDPRWRGTGPASDAGNFVDGNGRRGVLDQGVNDRFSDGQKDSHFGKENRAWNEPSAGAVSVIPSKPRSAEKFLGDADMSPDWNYSLKPSNCAEDECWHSTYSSPVPTTLLTIHGQDSTWNGLGQINHSTLINKEMRFDNPGFSQSNLNLSSNVLCGQGFDQNRQNLCAVTLPNLNPVGQANVAIPVDPCRGVTLNQLNGGMSEEGKLAEDPNKSQITGISRDNNTVSGQQLSQLTNVSASIAELLEAGKQLPLLYAALGATQPPPEEPINQVKPFLSNASIAPQEQYAHLSDIAEPKKEDNNEELKRAAGGEQADGSNTGNSNQAGPFESRDGKDSAEEAAKGSRKVDESKELRNDDQTEKEDAGVAKKDENGKKGKEAKSSRAFKFALVEFAKELLKPTWKDGIVGKEAYKTIVKKVVNKVTGSLKGSSIPQSQDKIDQYLSVSKPKLTKLVQAYVGKFQKLHN